MSDVPTLPADGGDDYRRPSSYGARTGPRAAAALVVGTPGGTAAGSTTGRSVLPSAPGVPTTATTGAA